MRDKGDGFLEKVAIAGWGVEIGVERRELEARLECLYGMDTKYWRNWGRQ